MRKSNNEWLKWQRQVIKEEYVKGDDVEVIRSGTNKKRRGWDKVASCRSANIKA